MLPNLYYKEPFVDTKRSAVHDCRHMIEVINYSLVNNNKLTDEQKSANSVFKCHQMVSGEKKVELSMGCTFSPVRAVPVMAWNYRTFTPQYLT